MTAQDPKTERLAEIVKRAAELAAVVPEPLREAAFNRVFDELTGRGGVGQHEESVEPPRTSTTRRGASKPSAASEDVGQDSATLLINSLSRTDHPEIATASRALERALHLLRIAEAEQGIDGMTAPQIAKVLTEKFRLRVSRQAITQALDAAGDYADRTPSAKGVVYRLMQPGEDYLAIGGAEAGGEKQPAPKTSRRRGRRRAAPKPETQEAGTKTAGTSTASTGRKRSGRGPKTLIEELIAEGFFSEPRAMGEIQKRLRHKKGALFKPTDLSPALVRLLRQNQLDRERNASNQYEYSVPA